MATEGPWLRYHRQRVRKRPHQLLFANYTSSGVRAGLGMSTLMTAGSPGRRSLRWEIHAAQEVLKTRVGAQEHYAQAAEGEGWCLGVGSSLG
jgi:hypothetical protein